MCDFLLFIRINTGQDGRERAGLSDTGPLHRYWSLAPSPPTFFAIESPFLWMKLPAEVALRLEDSGVGDAAPESLELL